MSYLPYRRGTILIPSGPKNHLHIVCNDPVYYPRKLKECVLMVNISSVNPALPYDPTCILVPGDHPFVRHESYVYYRKADVHGSETVAQCVDNGDFEAYEELMDDVFQRVLAGFFTSRDVKPKTRRFAEVYCR